MPRAKRLPLPADERTTAAMEPGAFETHTATSRQKAPSTKQARELERLERTRRNQQRSRQRRKEQHELLQEKVRKYEAQQVEATIAVQREARKVIKVNEQLNKEIKRLDERTKQLEEEIHLGIEARRLQEEEHRQLRALLKRHGISDGCVRTPPINRAMVPSRQQIPDHTGSLLAHSSTAVGDLERGLQPRQLNKCIEPSLGSSGPFAQHPRQGGGSRPADYAVSLKSRMSSYPGASSVWEVTPPNGMPAIVGDRDHYHSTHYTTTADSGTAITRTDAAKALRQLGSIKPDAGSSMSSGLVSATLSGEIGQQSAFDYNMDFFPAYSQPYPERQSVPVRSTGSTNLPPNYTHIPRRENNCTMATGLISTMTGLDLQHVRAELGCMPGADCHVDNESFNTVVDRYTAANAMQM